MVVVGVYVGVTDGDNPGVGLTVALGVIVAVTDGVGVVVGVIVAVTDVVGVIVGVVVVVGVFVGVTVGVTVGVGVGRISKKQISVEPVKENLKIPT